MAEHGSGPPPPPPGISHHDWELLSISMSSSSISSLRIHQPNPNPNPDPATLPPLQSASGSSPPPPPPPPSAAWNDPFLSDAASNPPDKLPEPFAEGWRPHLQPPSSAYDAYSTDHRSFPEDAYRNESFDLNQDVKPAAFHPDSYMMAAESIISTGGLSVKESMIESDIVEFEQVVIKKGRRNRAWWKQPRTSKVVLSVVVATTMLGIAALGRSLLVEKHQNQQLRLDISAKEEKLNDLVYQVHRLRDILGSQQKLA